MTLTELKKTYETEFAFLEKLSGVLDDERQALRARDADAILKITSTKQSLLEQLESLDKQRREGREKLLAAHQSDAGLIKYIETSDASLKKSLQGFQQENRVNMGILELGRIFTAEILSILRGQPITNSGTYDTHGGRDSVLSPKSLAKV